MITTTDLRSQWVTYKQLIISEQYPPQSQLEALLNEEDAGLESITQVKIMIRDEIAGNTNALATLKSLKKRRSELRNVNCIHIGELSRATRQALLEVLAEADIQEVMVHGMDRALMFPDALELWPKLNFLHLEKVAINEQAMKVLFEGLSHRERPMEGLTVDFRHCTTEALHIFTDSISQARLRQLSWYRIEQDELHELCGQLPRCETVRSFSIFSSTALPHYQWNHKMMEAITRAFQQMPSLQRFTLSLMEVASKQDMFALGRLAASRPSLEDLTVLIDRVPEDLSTFFLEGCGFHPRLRNAVLADRGGSAFNRIRYEYFQISQSWRAQCLVVLVAGATVHRVGAQSPLWRLPRDIFRKLLTFLDSFT